MNIYEELVARGLIAQVTNEEEIKEMINNGKATFYIGFDCTADSLHVGHFMALCLMKRLQMAGNKPIALIGDGTTLIGDPSGRTDMRQMLTEETIAHNAECFKRQMEKFIDFSDGKALMLRNSAWLKPLNYIELLREVGPCFSVNNMLRAECYKQRMEKGLSFLEFNYMIMQSYDFYYMFQHYGCNMQFGDADVLKCIRMLTFLPLEQIEEMDKWEGSQLNRAKEILAYELTSLVHGEEEAKAAEASSKALFGGRGDDENMPMTEITINDLSDGVIDIMTALVKTGLCASKSEARRNIQQGGVSVNDEKIADISVSYDADTLKNGIVIKRGKKNFNKLILK